jgi:hypothetical protein
MCWAFLSPGSLQVKVKVILRLTVNRPVHPGVRPPPGTSDQFFFHFLGNYLDICSLFFQYSVPSLTRG